MSSSGLDDAAKELLAANRQDRVRMEEEIEELRQRNVTALGSYISVVRWVTRATAPPPPYSD